MFFLKIILDSHHLPHLWFFHILNSKVEPDPEARIAGIRPNEEIILKLRDLLNPAKVTYDKT